MIKTQESNKVYHLFESIILNYTEMMKFAIFLIFSLLIISAHSQLLLDGVPFQFGLGGLISYTPTSGGINIPGYIMRIGYTKHQWIGVKFMTLTSNNNYDLLIFKRSTTSNSGVYECSITDYYVTQNRPDNLMVDTINNMDKQVTSNSDSNHFYLEIYRTRGNTTGEDWEGGDFVKICFFTSDSIFNKDTWTNQYETCYGFALVNFTSKWMGYEIIPSALIDGVQSKIYGGYTGPSLSLQLYIFRPNSNLTGSEITIRIGQQINKQLGFDYHKCLLKKGDYFGNSTTSMSNDLIYSGYNDTKCTVTNTSSYILLQFSRLLNTFDEFDYVITRDTQFCFTVGENENCYVINGQILFPQMTIESAIKIFGERLTWALALLMILILLSL